ncbi:MAG: hypothetical protein ABI042_06285 [Verrucomicrobiota bacterium]
MNQSQESVSGENYSLFDALRDRRSRRFGLGMKNEGGALAHKSRFAPKPLSEKEEAALVFAACGITGYALADLCYAPGAGGNIMAGLVGRTIGSGDAIHSVALAVTNDESTWLLKRPRDFSPVELQELIQKSRSNEFTEIYQRSRVLLKPQRAAPPVTPLVNISTNQWSAQAAGTTNFVPINDLSLLYINGLLNVLDESNGAFILDERAGFRPAGLGRFARSKGGHLEDDPKRGRVVTTKHVELMVAEFVSIEQGMMLQNLALMTEALGLGGFPYFANHETGWFEALGFRMQTMPVSQYFGVNRFARVAFKILQKDLSISIPLALEKNGHPLLKPFCPPYFPTMRAAVEAVVNLKFGSGGAFDGKTGIASWKDPAKISGKVPKISEAAFEAAVAYCEYLWARYGRFPVHVAPFRTVVSFQAAHLDGEFYDKFYREEALSAAQREDFEKTRRAEKL